MSDLIERLNTKAQMITLGERIAWGSETALMREAATALAEAEAEIVRLRGALDDIYRHVDWWSTRRISSHIRAALSRPHATKGEDG